ncbi:MAG: NAD(+) diphosphatase [Moraxella equi]|nr:NAD(+) diphosphatase [Moraxella equi]
MKHQSINTVDTQSSTTHAIWVVDGERVFCRDGKPYAFYHTEIGIDGLDDLDDGLDDTLGVVELLHFGDDGRRVFAIDYQKMTKPHPFDGELIAYRHAVAVTDGHTAHEISAGIQLLLWQKSNQFCGCCGTKTVRHRKENTMACPTCHQHFYPKIQPCVIIAITRPCPMTGQPQILLAQHHRHQATGMYGLIAGFMEVGESAEMTIHREVLEETGIRVDNIRYIKSQAWPYPTNLMLGFCATYKSGNIVIDEDELFHAQFFGKDDLPLIPKRGTIAYELISQTLGLDRYPEEFNS